MKSASGCMIVRNLDKNHCNKISAVHNGGNLHSNQSLGTIGICTRTRRSEQHNVVKNPAVHNGGIYGPHTPAVHINAKAELKLIWPRSNLGIKFREVFFCN